jgi:rubrerythrin
MATTIGNEDNLDTLLRHLVELDYDAIEAYEAAVQRLDNPAYKQTLERFCQDHINHTLNLSQVLRARGETPPDGPSAKRILTKGKVILADLMGDKAILKAMLSNEVDTNTAYDRATSNMSVPPETLEVLLLNHADEQKHKRWLESALQQISETDPKTTSGNEPPRSRAGRRGEHPPPS